MTRRERPTVRGDTIKRNAPACAHFVGYGGDNSLVYFWHQIELRFPVRRMTDEKLDAASDGCIYINEWDYDELNERAAMMGFICCAYPDR